MGYYTKFRFIGSINRKYWYFMKELYKECEEKPFWKEFAKKYPFAEKFSNLEYCEQLIYCPVANYIAYDSHSFIKNCACLFDVAYESDDYILEINTEFKDYDGEIQCFMETIVPEICKYVYLAISQGEDDEYPIMIFPKGVKKNEN